LHHVPKGSMFSKNRRGSRLGTDSLSLPPDGSQTTSAVLTRTMKRIRRSDAKKQAASATGNDAVYATGRSVPGKKRVGCVRPLVQFGDVRSLLVMARGSIRWRVHNEELNHVKGEARARKKRQGKIYENY
jgi:hypothetical protein